MEVAGADASMMSGSGVMLGEVAGMVVGTSFPVYKKLTLPHRITDPIKSHVGRRLWSGAA